MNTKKHEDMSLTDRAEKFQQRLNRLRGGEDLSPLIIEGQTLCVFLYLEKLVRGQAMNVELEIRKDAAICKLENIR